MLSTKQRILEAAIGLFNKRGVSNVPLKDIARQAGISPGNLAYHYHGGQDEIILEIFHQMKKEREAILMGVQQIPSFENINRQVLPLLLSARKYRFFHLDAVHLIRNYPQIASLQREYFEQSIQYVKAVIDYSIGSGNLYPEQHPGQYRRLAQTVWMLVTFWLEQLTLRELDDLHLDELRLSIWDLVAPHLTEKGKHHFEKIREETEVDH